MLIIALQWIENIFPVGFVEAPHWKFMGASACHINRGY